jgi:hypothetical protein
MTRSERTLFSLEGVEGLAAFGFELGGFASVLAEDESTGDEADEECEEVGDHGLFKKVSDIRRLDDNQRAKVVRRDWFFKIKDTNISADLAAARLTVPEQSRDDVNPVGLE